MQGRKRTSVTIFDGRGATVFFYFPVLPSVVRSFYLSPCITRGWARFGRKNFVWEIVRPCGGGRYIFYFC